MEPKKFRIKEALAFGWQTVKSNFGFFLGLMFVYMLLVLLPSAAAENFKKTAPALAGIIGIASWALNIIVQMGLIKIIIDSHDKKTVEINDLFSCANLFFIYLVTAILYWLAVAGGLFLLIVPGLIWLVQFSFCGYAVIDRKLDPVAALKYSSGLTRGVKKQLFVFGLVFLGINILGALALFVGLLITIPVTMLAAVSIYRKLQAATEVNQAVAPA